MKNEINMSLPAMFYDLFLQDDGPGGQGFWPGSAADWSLAWT